MADGCIHHVGKNVALKGREDFVGRDRLGGWRCEEGGTQHGWVGLGADASFTEVGETIDEHVDDAIAEGAHFV